MVSGRSIQNLTSFRKPSPEFEPIPYATSNQSQLLTKESILKYNISEEDQQAIGSNQHKNNHIRYNIIHAKNQSLLEFQKQDFRQNKSQNKSHRVNLEMLKAQNMNNLRA